MRYEGEFLSFKHNIVRHPFAIKPIGSGYTGKSVKVLLVTADPFVTDPSIFEEHNNIVKIFHDLKINGAKVEITDLFQEQARIERVIDEILKGVDIFHFIGHGLFNEREPEQSYLSLYGEPDNHGMLRIVEMETLVLCKPIRFCFLNACSTARTNILVQKKQVEQEGKNFVSMAHSLVDAGVPIVIATNHDIGTKAAQMFSHRFYQSALNRENRVDQAVREARTELYIARDGMFPGDWSCPILYARSENMSLAVNTSKNSKLLSVQSAL